MRHQVLTALLLAAGAANASSPSGFGLDVLVNGSPRPEFAARGTVYVEALKGRDYALRLSNPTGMRVAVALSVDGLNTIDAKHTSSRDARKWVLAPYQTVVIPGWQVNNAVSRKFVFTGERGSYGAALGKTEDLGIIEAVFYRERIPYRSGRWHERQDDRKQKDGETSLNERERRPDAPESGTLQDAAPPAARAEASARDHSQKSSSSSPSLDSSGAKLSDEYAATGMGNRTRFGIERVDVDLENEPAAVVRLRYEFRPQLVALGVLPSDPDPARIS
ncbi:MAG: hypothetical protein NEA02_16030, partial [Thermoanaerobaculia bacterium]|nr:hypothetical protein [Thermoanaerobaculia bacterium]